MMRRRKTAERSVRSLLLRSNILIIFIPSLILFALLFYTLIGDMRHVIHEERLRSLDQYNTHLEKVHRDVLYISNHLSMNSTINAMISQKSFVHAYDQISATNEIYRQMILVGNIFVDEEYDISIFATNGQSYYSRDPVQGSDSLNLEDLAQERWYQSLGEQSDALSYITADDSERLHKAFPERAAFAVKMLKNLNSGRHIGLLVVGMDAKSLFGGVYAAANDTDFLLVDSGGTIFAATGGQLHMNVEEWADPEQKIGRFDKGYFSTLIDEQAMQLYFVTNSQTSWKLVSVTPPVMQWPDYLRYIVIASVAFLLLVIIKTSWNATYLSRRMAQIVESIEELDLNTLQGRITGDWDAEFRLFVTVFNQTLDRIARLSRELETREKEKHEAEIQALQFQINPHFLYNTIASIRFMMQMGRYEDGDIALRELVNLLKGIFANQQMVVPLATEFESVRQYLKIMQYRFQDTFEFTLSIEAGLEQCAILKFALQPLVENSITHGFNDLDRMGEISVRATRRGANIVVLVEDNGDGSNIEQIHAIIDDSSSVREGSGVTKLGLRNVQQRIQRNFGQEYGIRARSNEKSGITIELVIPFIGEGHEFEDRIG